jgi:trehalose-6-phosphatase
MQARTQTENVVFSAPQNDQPGAQAQGVAKKEQRISEIIVFPSDDSDDEEHELNANSRKRRRWKKSQLTEEDEADDQPQKRRIGQRAQ